MGEGGELEREGKVVGSRAAGGIRRGGEANKRGGGVKGE